MSGFTPSQTPLVNMLKMVPNGCYVRRGNVLVQIRRDSLPCTVRTSRQNLCNQRVGCLLVVIMHFMGLIQGGGPGQGNGVFLSSFFCLGMNIYSKGHILVTFIKSYFSLISSVQIFQPLILIVLFIKISKFIGGSIQKKAEN